MTNLEKYDHVFIQLFQKEQEELSGLTYLRGNWDSLMHIELVSLLEDAFDISMDSGDVVVFNSYQKGKQIMLRYGIEV